MQSGVAEKSPPIIYEDCTLLDRNRKKKKKTMFSFFILRIYRTLQNYSLILKKNSHAMLTNIIGVDS